MKVNFYATLRDIVGGKTVDVLLPEGSTVNTFLNRLCKSYPDLKREILDENGELYQHVHIILNGRDVPYLEDELETIIQPDDIISIFPAVGGG
jgi:sulfur-carrier protein